MDLGADRPAIHTTSRQPSNGGGVADLPAQNHAGFALNVHFKVPSTRCQDLDVLGFRVTRHAPSGRQVDTFVGAVDARVFALCRSVCRRRFRGPETVWACGSGEAETQRLASPSILELWSLLDSRPFWIACWAQRMPMTGTC